MNVYYRQVVSWNQFWSVQAGITIEYSHTSLSSNTLILEKPRYERIISYKS